MDIRLSKYTLPVKCSTGDLFLINGLTGAIDIIDADTFNSVRNGKLADVGKSIIARLTTRGYLTSLDENVEIEHFQNIAKRLEVIDAKNMANGFTIIPTYDCNFRCPYCFEHNAAVSRSHGVVMSRKMADLCFQAIDALVKDEPRHSKNITLFGGEPLLVDNTEIIRYIVNKGRDAGFTFSAVTNGYDLAEYADLLGSGMIEFVQVTLDGDREFHDKRRYHYLTKASFDRILDNVELALAKRIRVAIRVNIDADNKERVEPLIDILKSRGLFGKENLGIYVAFISGEDNHNPANYDCPSNYISYEDFAERALDMDASVGVETAMYRRLKTAIDTKTSYRLSPFYCGADSCSYIFDPLGRVFGCLSFVGDHDKAIGNYLSGKIDITRGRERRKCSRLRYIEQCKTCEYGLLCGGGCSALKNNNCKKDFVDRLTVAVNKAIITQLINY